MQTITAIIALNLIAGPQKKIIMGGVKRTELNCQI